MKMRWWEWLLFLLGLAAFAAQAALASPLKSAAFDEEYHIAAGYAYLKTGDFRMSTSHPPLVDTLSAVPLLFLDNIKLPIDHPSWAESDYFIFSDVFLWQANENPHEIVVNGRYPIIFLGAILAAVLFFWARQMAGAWAGWIALILAAFDPNLIANSRLITTDLGLTLFMTLTMWRLWVWLKRPSLSQPKWRSWLNLILVGVLAGCTMAAKFTGLLIWPMIVGVLLLDWLKIEDRRLKIEDLSIASNPSAGSGHVLQSLILNLFVLFLAAYAALWVIYRFDFGLIPGSSFPLPIPAPFYPYSLWDTFRVIEEQPKAAYLLGQVSDRGWWYYFPVALALKTTIPLLLLTAVGFLLSIKEEGWRKTAVLWLPPLLFMLLAMTGRITIGYRHILPVVPFLIMLAAQSGRRFKIEDLRLQGTRPQSFDKLRTNSLILRQAQDKFFNLSILLLLAWSTFGALRLWPHQEAFFNELAGGSARGSELLVDANIDWGQDLLFLRDLLAERGIDEVYLGYFGTALPEAYGLNYKPLPGFMRFTAGSEIDAYNPYTPLPGWYALSETSKQLGLMLQNTDMYAYFQDKEPVACAGYSICLYEVVYPDDVVVERVVVNGRSVSDIPPEELGITGENRVVAKWVQSPDSLVFPLGEGFEPPARFAPIGADFEGAFELLGAALTGGGETDTSASSGQAVSPGDPLNLTLYWQVGSAVIDTPNPSRAAPLASFIHLSGADPAHIIAQADGWPTALSGLEPGDVIAQPVTLFIPPDALPGDYFLRVGLYSPQSGRRLLLPDGGDAVMVNTVKVE